MCLDHVDMETKKDVGYAYKVFDEMRHRKYYPLIHNSGFWGILFDYAFVLFRHLYPLLAKHYKIGGTYKSSEQKIEAFYGTTYSSGFHCFVSESDAFRWRECRYPNNPVLKVAIEDIVASGKQDGLDVLVARKMKLIEGCQTDT